MSLAPGVRLGAYEVLRLIGAGGMGEVYQARDTRLDRIVAIKVLPEKFAADHDRRQRFEREARAVAALNHPHICDLHDVGEHDSVGFLVMEYLEGQTLADRLVRGPLPTADVLRYAVELADALDHAHRRGLVHRDLKPGNVMLTKVGAKLLDFSLSKLQSAPDLTALSTIASGNAPLTAQGAVLGTYPYMAPEQLEGHETDARSDIFAFGAIVYEMTTGRRAFQGGTAASLIGAILHTDPPPVSSLQPLTPPGLDRVLARCLAKDPNDRWQTARDLMLELKWIAEHDAPPVAYRQRRSRIGLLAATALAVLAIAASGFTVAYFRRTPAEPLALRLALTLPANVSLADLAEGGPIAISPDGRRLAFVASADDGKQLLWVRQLDLPTAQVLPGSDGASYPFWSPDSKSIGFFAKGNLLTTDPASGRPPHKLCEVKQPRGGTWSKAGVIVFSGNAGDQLYRVAADGGPVAPLPGKRSTLENLWPSFLPDGRHIIYFGRPDKPGIYITTLDSDETVPIANAMGYVGAVYASGYLVMLSSGSSSGAAQSASVMAQPFDPERLELTGEAFLVEERVLYRTLQGRGAFSVSENGTLVTESAESRLSQLMWFDRAGQKHGSIGAPARHRRRPALTPDGTIVAVERLDPLIQTLDIWLIDDTRKQEFPLTSDPGIDFNPVPSPDGTRIVFSSARNESPPTLYQRAATGAGRDERLLSPGFLDHPTDWTRDGRFILFARRDPTTQWDLWALPALPDPSTGDRKPVLLLGTEANEHHPQASPSGRWLAYESDDSGNWEVFVRPFMASTANDRWQISTNGGIWPRWRQDGKELFFISPRGDLMAAAIEPGHDFQSARPQALFKTRIADMAIRASSYVPTADGQRFLINSYLEDTNASTVRVVLNWPALLRR